MRNWKRYLRENLSLPAMHGHRDERAIDEIADHLADRFNELVSRGVSEEEAERQVMAWFGDPRRAAAELTGAEPHRAPARVGRWLERQEEGLRMRGSVWSMAADRARDLRFGLRALAKRPAFAGIVILVLALGIAATSAIFTLVDAVVLSPLPFDEADRLVAVQHAAPGRGMSDVGQCAAWHFTYEDESSALENLGMFTDGTVSVTTADGRPEAVPALFVTDGVFRAVRLTPAAGRIFIEDDMDPDGRNTIMLGHGYWQSRFGGDAGVIGETLQVDGATYEIIGVAPSEVTGLGSNPAIIEPLRFRRSQLFIGNIGYDAVARLRDGVTLEAAAADLNRVLPLAWEKFPGGPVASSTDPSFYVAEVRDLKEDIVGETTTLLWLLLGGVGVVLLIACANAANLFLVRADDREGEMAMRLALGASAGRIGWEYLTESLLLGLIGGAAGLLLAQLGLRSLLALAPASIPRLDEVSLNPDVLFFTLAISLGSGLLFGLFPMLRHRRRGVVASLKEGGRSGMGSRRRHRTQNILAVSQIALALVLLVGSGLMIRSVQALRNVDPGFHHADEILAIRLNIPSRVTPDLAEVASTYEAIVHRLEQIPGVISVGLASGIPMHGGGNVNPFFVRDQTVDPDAPRISRRHKWIGEGYLETLGIPLLAGRSFTWDDVHNRAPVAMLSERLAREVFGSVQAALRQRIAARPDPAEWKEVVGVVADVHEDGMSQPPPALVYWPQVTLGFWEGNPPTSVQTWRGMGIAIRSERAGTDGFRREVEQAVWDVNPNLPLLAVRRLSELTSDSVARTAFTMVLLVIAGAVAVILGLVGVYGVISYAVSQRTKELGIRIAMGAGTGQVRSMVLRQGLLLAVIGIALGLGLSLGLSRVMASVLFGVSPTDAVTYLIVAGGLVVVALLASLLPARRAAHVDPMMALRAE